MKFLGRMNSKTIGIILLTILIGNVIHNGYRLYKLNDTNIVENMYHDNNIAIYIDGEKSNEFPTKTSGKVFEKLVCTDSLVAKWNNSEWTLSIENITTPTKCDIYFKEFDETTTLRYKILAQGGGEATIEAKGNPNFTVVPNSSTSGIYVAQDEYGKSYYYRGERNSLKNNVIFAGFQWKVIRINGDGSIRLIYNGKCPNNNCTINTTELDTGINGGIGYFWSQNQWEDAKYVGYMFGGANGVASTSKVQAQKNETDSSAKKTLDEWYESNIKNTEYESYIVDNIFCNDRSIITGQGYGSSEIATNYKSYTRLLTSNPTPTLKCEQQNDRFTVNDVTLGNGVLKYPVGLITSDEVLYAGTGLSSNYNTNQYLYTNHYCWTFSPSSASKSAFGTYIHYLGYQAVANVSNTYLLRAVLSLSSNVVVSSGDGTSSNPYIIEVN